MKSNQAEAADKPTRRHAANEQESAAAPSFAFSRVGDGLRAGLKPIAWLVRNYIESDSLALFFGDPGCGKSFAAIDLACCVATGTPWHRNRTSQGAVFYIAGEGQNGLMRRFGAWAQHNGVTLHDAPLFVSERPAQLCSMKAAAEVATAVDELQATTGETPALIVVDTLARNFGGDENSQEDMGAFIANIDNFLRGKWKATVLVVHHSGHGDKTRSRGSSALKGALDAEYSLTKDEDGVVRIEATKMKDAELPPARAFRMERIELDGLFDDEGEPVTSVGLSIVEGAAGTTPAPKMRGRGKNQKRALDALRELHGTARKRVADDGRNPSAALVSMDRWRERLIDVFGDRRRAWEAANTLVESGKVVKVAGGYVRIADDVDDDEPF